MDRWAYKVEELTDGPMCDPGSMLTNRGHEGWELVSVVRVDRPLSRGGNGTVFYFKRCIPEQK